MTAGPPRAWRWALRAILFAVCVGLPLLWPRADEPLSAVEEASEPEPDGGPRITTKPASSFPEVATPEDPAQDASGRWYLHFPGRAAPRTGLARALGQATLDVTRDGLMDAFVERSLGRGALLVIEVSRMLLEIEREARFRAWNRGEIFGSLFIERWTWIVEWVAQWRIERGLEPLERPISQPRRLPEWPCRRSRVGG